jgi:SAM-dependent methyltransferase
MGFGQYSDRLARLFPKARLIGLEIDKAHLYGGEAYFHAVHPGFNFTLGDVQILPFKDASFDLIVTVDVMEHIPDDRATFAEYARVLRPGGRILMHTPRDTTPVGSSHDHDHWEVGEHVRDGYRDADAREKIETAGLKIEQLVRGYGKPGMFAWTLLQRVPMSLLGKSRVFIPVVMLWLPIVIVPAVVAMYLDRAPGDRPEGGSLMVVATKPR